MTESKGSGSVKYLGWESSNYYEGDSDWVDISENPHGDRWLHVCGKSIYKRTAVIIDSWLPHYPTLEIIYSPRDVKNLVRRDLSNIVYIITDRVSQEELIHKMNTRKVHLCPSETEGGLVTIYMKQCHIWCQLLALMDHR